MPHRFSSIPRKALLFSLAAVLTASAGSPEQARDARAVSAVPLSPVYEDPDPYDWPISSPEEQGLDGSIFEHAFREAEKLPDVESVLVVRHGFLIAEKYFNGRTMFSAGNVHSVSKSFLSALAGIAFRENFLSSLDQKMMDFFPEYAAGDLDPSVFNITLRHLLTMRAGFSWEDSEANWNAYASSPDWVRYVLHLPLRDEPGARFNYSTVQSNLLSAILAKASGMSTKELAEKYLLGPLDIRIPRWGRDPQGFYTGGHEMYISARDMARFGYLFLQKGVVDGQSIVPGDWIDASWIPSGTSPWDWGPLPEGKYGLHWWLGNMSGYEIFFASGRGGQQIILVPVLDLIIVTKTDTESWFDSDEKWYAMLRLAAYHILTGIKSSLGLPPYPPAKVTAKKILNSGLVYREYIDVLDWKPGLRNEEAGAAAAKYRVYFCNFDRLDLLAEVDGRTSGYWVRRVGQTSKNLYAVTTVTADGRESLPAYTWGISTPIR